MTALATFPGFDESHPSLAAFYAADSRRWESRELDIGLRWRGAGATYRAAIVEATGELYLFEHMRPDGGGGMVFVHERASDDWRRPATFDGWEEVCGAEGSFDWFLARASAAAAGGGGS